MGHLIHFDQDTIENLDRLIFEKRIQTIHFVLSDDNRIVLDVLGKQRAKNINSLQGIKPSFEYTPINYHTPDQQFLALSYYLNYKIEAFRQSFKKRKIHHPIINGKIYFHHQQIFQNIYAKLIDHERIAHLN
ncbi:MAG: hypothetical protein AAF598_13905 [Bacteroidota bacterium]